MTATQNGTTTTTNTPPTVGQLAEQRHQLYDLDPDSTCRIDGATCPACPPRDQENAA